MDVDHGQLVLCQRLKVTPGNDFELLRIIGGECAGALTISHEPPTEAFSVESYRPVDREQLRLWSRAIAPDVFSSTVGRDGVRLSLAGAQDKLPVRVDGEAVSVPLGAAPSTHLLKFGSAHFKYLPEERMSHGDGGRAVRAAGSTDDPLEDRRWEHHSRGRTV